MKIKLDENLPTRLALVLDSLGHDVDSVREEGLTGRDDAKVWEESQRAGRFLVTQDLDFSDIRRFAPGSHHGLLLARLVIPGREHLLRRLEEVFRNEAVESWARCFVVVTDRKVRVRRTAR